MSNAASQNTPQDQPPAPPVGASQAAPADTVEAAATAAALAAELAAMEDRYLRCHAELDNYRKRAQRELEEQRRYANLGLLRDLLPVLDNVDRAIQAAQQGKDPEALLQGFRMTGQQLHRVLDQHHCQPIEALNQPFDPRLHEAIMQVPSDQHPAGTVVQVALPGYRLHERVVRASQVVVSARPAEPMSAESGDDGQK